MKLTLIITPIRVPKVLERTAVSHTETTKNDWRIIFKEPQIRRQLAGDVWTSEKRCIICGCKDHRLIGCSNHRARKCSCYEK